MKYCKTNQLNVNFEYESILNDFAIVKFSTTENYIKYGALILDEVNLQINAKSIVFEQGKSFYALFSAQEFKGIDFASKIRLLEDGDDLVFEVLDSKAKLLDIPQHLLAQLLINSIATPNHKRLNFNNLTGKLYLLNPNFFQISRKKDKEQIFKIVGLEFKIAQNFSLELNVRTFSSLLLSKKMDFSKKALSKYPKYTFVHATNTLKRVLNSESYSVEELFILKQERNSKSHIPFLSFKNYEQFENSKVGILQKTLSIISAKLCNYIEITFCEETIIESIRYQSTPTNSHKLNVALIDGIDDEDSNEKIEELKSIAQNEYPDISFSIRSKEIKNNFNIKLIHNQAHYKKYNTKDPYQSKTTTQHITFEDFKTNSKASLKAVMNELQLKRDVSENQVKVVDWEKFNYTNNWIFISKSNTERDNDLFSFLTINPKGEMKFEEFEPNLFNQNEYDELCGIFNSDSNIELLIKDDADNINAIKKTNNYTLPEFQYLSKELSEEAEIIKLTKEQAVSYLDEVQQELKQTDIIDKIHNITDWNKSTLLKSFTNRNDKKRFVNHIQKTTGEVLKTYFRDKTKYEILDSQLDIHLFNKENKQFYFVGTKGEGIQQNISRASVIREIETANNSNLIFQKLLPLMNVDFVRNGDLTVLPFPYKYLREWNKTKVIKNIS